MPIESMKEDNTKWFLLVLFGLHQRFGRVTYSRRLLGGSSRTVIPSRWTSRLGEADWEAIERQEKREVKLRGSGDDTI